MADSEYKSKPRFPVFGCKYAIVFFSDGAWIVYRERDWDKYIWQDTDIIRFIPYTVVDIILTIERDNT